MRWRRFGGLFLLVAALALAQGRFRSRLGTQDSAERTAPATPSAALADLEAGNRRYMDSARTRSVDTCHDAAHRHELTLGQHPHAVVLTCSDSRLCPEFIFDQREGAIFEIRNAGNLVDDDVLATVEYGVEHLHVPLVVVLGHKSCGAVKAVCEAGGAALPDHLKSLQDHMAGIRSKACSHRTHPSPEFLDEMAADNARHQALALLKESRPLRAAAATGCVLVVYGLYDMESGHVQFWPL